MPLVLRDEVVDFVTGFTRLSSRSSRWVLGQLGIAPGQFRRWTKRYGRANAHNGLIPRAHWLTPTERQAILDYHERHP